MWDLLSRCVMAYILCFPASFLWCFVCLVFALLYCAFVFSRSMHELDHNNNTLCLENCNHPYKYSVNLVEAWSIIPAATLQITLPLSANAVLNKHKRECCISLFMLCWLCVCVCCLSRMCVCLFVMSLCVYVCVSLSVRVVSLVCACGATQRLHYKHSILFKSILTLACVPPLLSLPASHHITSIQPLSSCTSLSNLPLPNKWKQDFIKHETNT